VISIFPYYLYKWARRSRAVIGWAARRVLVLSGKEGELLASPAPFTAVFPRASTLLLKLTPDPETVSSKKKVCLLFLPSFLHRTLDPGSGMTKFPDLGKNIPDPVHWLHYPTAKSRLNATLCVYETEL
jgi:hypothetical protein